jgi:multiple sugar transport system permease protein
VRRRIGRLAWGLVFLSPGLGLIACFVILPIALTGWISLHVWSMYTPLGEMTWVGIENYAAVLRDPTFQQALANTLTYTLASVSLLLPFSIFFGIFLYRAPVRGREGLRVLLFSTYMVPAVVVAIIWGYLYSPLYGPLNQLLGLVGVPAQQWLSSPGQAMWGIVVLNLWQTLGYYAVLVMAGLTQIPQDFYDASAIDGAGPVAQVRYVTLPLLRRTLTFVVVIALINSLQVFDPIYVLTQGGPVNSTDVLSYEIFRTAFQFGRAGAASAMAILLLFALVAIVPAVLFIARETD